MNNKFVEIFHSTKLSEKILKLIRKKNKNKIRIMEVCGTHTVSIFRTGIRFLLPDSIELLSGPGCPVCVTSQAEIDSFIRLSKEDGVIIATFGDLMKVPGNSSTLQKEKSFGADIRIVYSVFDAIEIAKNNANKNVVFLGIGFETTAPTVAAAIVYANKVAIDNFFIVSAHKIVPPAIEALTSSNKIMIDGFILPGHVSAIIGMNAYKCFWEKYQIPCVITGFKKVDLLRGIFMLINQIETNITKLDNGYLNVVNFVGNLKAIELLNEVFKISDVTWRGLGEISNSGLVLRKKYKDFDAYKRFNINVLNSYEDKSCICGEILMGIKKPFDCILYKKVCNPMNPIGPCMVSSEGSCAAYYNYTV